MLQQHPQLSNLIDDNDDSIPSSDDLALHVGYGRVKVKHLLQDDYVKTRLKVARMIAMEKYREVWG